MTTLPINVNHTLISRDVNVIRATFMHDVKLPLCDLIDLICAQDEEDVALL